MKKKIEMDNKSSSPSKQNSGTLKSQTPLLERAWAYMSEGIRQTISSEPIIPAIASKAKVIAAQNPGFIRSDQGQVVGVFPEKEIYYGPSAGLMCNFFILNKILIGLYVNVYFSLIHTK